MQSAIGHCGNGPSAAFRMQSADLCAGTPKRMQSGESLYYHVPDPAGSSRDVIPVKQPAQKTGHKKQNKRDYNNLIF